MSQLIKIKLTTHTLIMNHLVLNSRLSFSSPIVQIGTVVSQTISIFCEFLNDFQLIFPFQKGLKKRGCFLPVHPGEFIIGEQK